MGGGSSQRSQEDCDSYAFSLYYTALQSTCVLPDVGIDESLLKYSGLNSNAELQAYSDELLNSIPGYVEKLSTGLGAFTSVPNAVGLGALVISMIMEIFIKSSTQTSPDIYSLLHRVFGEEKASAVRDTMSEYLKRHLRFINNDQRLLEEIKRLEEQLSDQLTILRNSLIHDNQMSTRGFKIWVNGASFHVQMMLHEARLKVKAGEPASHFVNPIETATGLYLRELESLLEKYKTYQISTTEIKPRQFCMGGGGGYACKKINCFIRNTEKNCKTYHIHQSEDPCNRCDMTEAYINHVFSRYEPISSLRNHFSNMKNNVNSLINQHNVFTLPSAT